MPIHLPPITRREFVAGSLAACASGLFSEQLLAADRRVDTSRCALLADIHISGNRAKWYTAAGIAVNMTDNFNVAIRGILALDPRPANMIIAGDCADQVGLAGDYAVLADLVKPVRAAGISVHFLMGNHDRRENFFNAFPEAAPEGKPDVPGKHVSIVSLPHANWFLLDSLQEDNVAVGLLGEDQLAWLASALDSHTDKPALVMAHHDPTRRDAALADFDALYKVMKNRKRVKAYFYGHMHRWERPFCDSIHLIAIPTTAWLFDHRQPRGWIDARLRPDGSTLIFNPLNKNEPVETETIQFRWRT